MKQVNTTQLGPKKKTLSTKEKINLYFAKTEKITSRDLVVFTQNFYLLRKANFNNIHALSTIIESTENYVGIYQYTLNDDAEGDTESSLELTSDKTFLFKANMCSGVLSIKGDYKIEKDVITLQNMSVHNDFKELLETNLHGSNTISFKIVSEKEIYLETSQFGCTTSGKEKGSFIKQ